MAVEQIVMFTMAVTDKAINTGCLLLPREVVRRRELPAVLTMASIMHQGSLQDVGQAISALFAWIGVNGYSACGAEREVHLFGREIDLKLLAPVMIEMQIPVEKTTPIPL